MSASYKHTGTRLPIATASGTIAGGVPVVQEGLIGVVFGDVASGSKGEMSSTGVWTVTVPGGTVKGDALYVPGSPATESNAPVLTKTAAGNTLFGVALTDRSGGFSDVRLSDAAISGSSLTGVADGYKIARGEGTLDGSNPTPIATGLTTIVAFVATLKGTAAPGVGTSTLTADISGVTGNVYAWKPTSSANPTLIASTGTENFYWIAVGT